MNEKQIFCHNMLKLRKHLGMTQKDFAKALHIGVRSLSLIEKGRIPDRLGATILIRIYHCFGIMPSEMFSEEIPLNKAHLHR